MKRHGNLFDKICDMENLKLAFNKAKKNKGKRDDVKEVEADLDNKLKELQEQLINGTYKTSPYKLKEIYEPKKRTIYVLPFYPDRIVHHAIMNVLEPIWDNLMYFHSYSCRDNKGQHKAGILCMKYVKQYKYCLQCDIHKFYPSINHKILKRILRKKIKDTRLLQLLDEIIDSVGGSTNVPIGNFLSQWFGNLYLNELDTRAKQIYHSPAYLRYCDDFLFFSNDKNELNYIRKTVEKWLGRELQLSLSKASLFYTAQGVDFLGYRYFPTKVLLRKRTAKRVKKRMTTIIPEVESGILSINSAMSIVGSYFGWIKHAQTYNLRLRINMSTIDTWLRNYRKQLGELK
jgi:RNA-directed DNA polymerase